MPQRTTDESGREIILYSNGSKKDAKTGHWLSPPVDENGRPDTPVTRDPSGMRLRRNEISKQRAIEALDEGAGLDPSLWGTGLGWQVVISHTVQTYLKSNNIRGMGEVLSKLGTATGYLGRDDEPVTANPTEFVKALESFIKTVRENEPEIIEAE